MAVGQIWCAFRTRHSSIILRFGASMLRCFDLVPALAKLWQGSQILSDACSTAVADPFLRRSSSFIPVGPAIRVDIVLLHHFFTCQILWRNPVGYKIEEVIAEAATSSMWQRASDWPIVCMLSTSGHLNPLDVLISCGLHCGVKKQPVTNYELQRYIETYSKQLGLLFLSRVALGMQLHTSFAGWHCPPSTFETRQLTPDQQPTTWALRSCGIVITDASCMEMQQLTTGRAEKIQE
jgi:hypothetical protein